MAWPDDWGRKTVITIQASLADSNLTNFPVLLTQPCLPNEVVDSDEANRAQSDGGDLRFYSGDYSASDPATEDTNRIPCEIVDFTQHSTPGSATVEIWVQVPSINSSTGASITMYYNATGKSQPAADAAYGREAVWDSAYEIVSHMKDLTTTTVLDSTSNDRDGTGSAFVTEAVGKVGECQRVNFTGNDINFGNILNFDHDDAYTVQGWFKISSGIIGYLAQKWDWAGDDHGWRIYVLNSGTVEHWMSDGAGNWYGFKSSSGYDDGTFHHFSRTSDTSGNAANGQMFIDGADDTASYSAASPGSCSTTYNLNALGLWALSAAGFWLDELRITSDERTAAEMAADYRTQNAPATYAVEGTPVSVLSAIKLGPMFTFA